MSLSGDLSQPHALQGHSCGAVGDGADGGEAPKGGKR